MIDKYIGIIEISKGRYFTILKDANGYKAVNPTNNGYFTIVKNHAELGTLYNHLYSIYGNVGDDDFDGI